MDAAPSRRTKRRRRKAERSKPRPEWTRFEPRSRTVQILDDTGTVALIVAVLVGWLCAMIYDVVRWENLRARGQNASAVVVHVTVDQGEDTTTYFVHGYVAACDCLIKVHVNDHTDYQVGSYIAVRYDPQDHSNAEARTDRVENLLPTWIGLWLLVTTFAVVLGIRELRRRRRARALIGSGAPKRSMRFQAWRWKLGDNTKHYLVLIDASTSDWSEPLCYVPVERRRIRRLESSDILQLYGGGDAKTPAVLRHESTVIVPTGAIVPGRRQARDRVG
jgi:hypothetical protein